MTTLSDVEVRDNERRPAVRTDNARSSVDDLREECSGESLRLAGTESEPPETGVLGLPELPLVGFSPSQVDRRVGVTGMVVKE